MSANITNLTADTFKAAIANDTVLVDLWAPWCPPCKSIAPVLEQVADELAGKIKVVKVDIQDHPTVAESYGIRSIPTFLVFKNGRLVEKIVGVNGITSKVSFINRLQPHLA
jgi:thioredoxin 1